MGKKGKNLDTGHEALGTIQPGIYDLVQYAYVGAGMCLMMSKEKGAPRGLS